MESSLDANGDILEVSVWLQCCVFPDGHHDQGPRVAHSRLLAEGTVLTAGGLFGNNASPNSAELYGPSTGIFTAIGNMAAARSLATLLNNGKGLVSGGVLSAPDDSINAAVHTLRAVDF